MFHKTHIVSGTVRKSRDVSQNAYCFRHCKRKHLLQQLDYDNPVTVSQLVEGWGSLKAFTDITNGQRVLMVTCTTNKYTIKQHISAGI